MGMEGRYLRSVSLHAAEDAKKTDLTRVKTLKRHLMKTLKRQKTVIGTTTQDCTNEFHFVKFDTIQSSKESGSQVMDKEYACKDMEKWTSDKDDKFDSDVKLLNQKGQMVLKLQTCKKSVAYLRKPEGLKDWYENILDNIKLLKMKKRESLMSRSLLTDSQFGQKPCSNPVISRPCMGVSSLAYKKQFLP